MRIMTWNIHGGVGPDRRCDLDRVIATVRRQAPDVVALQEVDSRSRRFPGAFEKLSEALGGHRAEAKPLVATDGEYGHVLLSRWPIPTVRLHDLSMRRREPRAAIEAVVDAPAGPLHLVAVHLGLGLRERRDQAALLAALGETGQMPSIVLGDFNEWWPNGAVRTTLGARFPLHTHHRTFPSRLPLLPLDRIYAASHVVIRESWTDPAAREASDHLPLIADLAWGPDGVPDEPSGRRPTG